MHLKRYKRKTVQEALRAVREDLGPEALVLSTRMVPAPGVRGWIGGRAVEVTAAAERLPMSEDRHLAGPSTSLRAGRYDDPREDAATVLRAGLDEDRYEPRSGSLGARRPATLTSRKAAAAQRVEEGIAARLEAAGIDSEFARDVARSQPSNGRRGATIESLRRTLAERLTSLAATDNTFAPVEVFIGPPGAGKTTTIAKIAAQERARNGKRLGLVAADGFRVGAVEQLRLYADILGSPLMVARDPGELEELLDEARRPLLLDTAGRSPSDAASRDMLRVLTSRSDVRTHLVLAASTPCDLARRIFDRFEDARPSRVILTKLDEAESLAALLPVLRERELPISYLGFGQNVPEDLQRATASAIAAWVSGEGQTVPSGTSPLGFVQSHARGKGTFACA
jgi:flagellar biosynthesis protein FlhF